MRFAVAVAVLSVPSTTAVLALVLQLAMLVRAGDAGVIPVRRTFEDVMSATSRPQDHVELGFSSACAIENTYIVVE